MSDTNEDVVALAGEPTDVPMKSRLTTVRARGKQLDELQRDLEKGQRDLEASEDEKTRRIAKYYVKQVMMEIDELKNKPLDAMDALGNSLRYEYGRKKSTQSTVTSSSKISPLYPETFNVMTMDQFQTLTQEHIDWLMRIETPTYYSETEYATIALNKTGVSGFVQPFVGSLFVFCWDNGILPRGTYLAVGNVEGVLGAADCVLGVVPNFDVIPKGEEMLHLNDIDIIMELRTIGYSMENMAGNFQMEKTNSQSPIRQLYNYMVANNKLFGILGTYDEWVGLIHDGTGNVLCTPTFHRLHEESVEHFSVSQFLVLFYKLADKGDTVVAFVKEKGVVWCDGAVAEQSEDHDEKERTETTVNKKNKNRKKKHKREHKKDGALVPFSELSIHDLIGPPSKRTSVGSGLMGTAWNAVVYGKPAILKTADILKHPEFEKTMQFEAKVYEQLSELQGRCIPRLLGHGQTLEGFLYALATEPVGEPISLKHIDKLETFRERATEVLQELHQHGVLHGDIRAPNLLIHPDEDRVFLLDFGMSELFDPAEANDDPTNTWTVRLSQEKHELDKIFDSLQQQSKCSEPKTRAGCRS